MIDLTGQWRNQNGSVLTIEAIQDDGSWSGTFASTKGRAAQDKVYPASGWINGEVLSISVNFCSEEANLSSITSFSGRLEGDVLHTVWVLARQYADPERTKPTQPWNAFLVNSDQFVREP